MRIVSPFVVLLYTLNYVHAYLVSLPSGFSGGRFPSSSTLWLEGLLGRGENNHPIYRQSNVGITVENVAEDVKVEEHHRDFVPIDSQNSKSSIVDNTDDPEAPRGTMVDCQSHHQQQHLQTEKDNLQMTTLLTDLSEAHKAFEKPIPSMDSAVNKGKRPVPSANWSSQSRTKRPEHDTVVCASHETQCIPGNTDIIPLDLTDRRYHGISSTQSSISSRIGPGHKPMYPPWDRPGSSEFQSNYLSHQADTGTHCSSRTLVMEKVNGVVDRSSDRFAVSPIHDASSSHSLRRVGRLNTHESSNP